MQDKTPFKFFSLKDHTIAGIRFEPTSWKFMVISSIVNWVLTNFTWLLFMIMITTTLVQMKQAWNDHLDRTYELTREKLSVFDKLDVLPESLDLDKIDIGKFKFNMPKDEE